MTIAVDLPPDIAFSLTQKAAQNGQTIAGYLQQLAVQQAQAVPTGTMEPRTPGLHAGQYWIATGFDAPLPDSFWLGENADNYYPTQHRDNLV